jgi:hypothetical protein
VQILLSLVIVASLAGAAYIYVPPEKPLDLESATGLTTAQLVDIANDQCGRYESTLSSSPAGMEYENWVDNMTRIVTSKDALRYRKNNNAVYDFAKIDLPEKLRARGAFTLQTLIVEDSRLSVFPLGEWNMFRLEEFYPDTFSVLASNMAALSLKECGLTGFSDGVQELTQQAKRVMALANSPSSSSSANGCGAVISSIGTVRNLFAQGTATPSETASILRSAASVWNGAASSETGSKASWLRKMSELSSSLSGYIMNGSPSNGDQLLGQLNNNFNLSSQFCD